MRGFKLLLLKAYFDKGLGLTNYIKYLIAFFGIASNDAKTTLIIAVVYGILCFFIGWAWYYYRLIDTENEISNIFNPFVNDMRKKLKVKRFK